MVDSRCQKLSNVFAENTIKMTPTLTHRSASSIKESTNNPAQTRISSPSFRHLVAYAWSASYNPLKQSNQETLLREMFHMKLAGLALSILCAVALYFAFTSRIITVKIDGVTHVQEILKQVGSSLSTGQVLGAASSMLQRSISEEDLAQSSEDTVLSGIDKLYETDNFAPATIILICSVIIPVLKTLLAILFTAQTNFRPKLLADISLYLHRYSLVEVIIVALMVMSMSRISFVDIELGPAIYYYVGYFVLTIIVFEVFLRDVISPARERTESSV